MQLMQLMQLIQLIRAHTKRFAVCNDNTEANTKVYAQSTKVWTFTILYFF